MSSLSIENNNQAFVSTGLIKKLFYRVHVHRKQTQAGVR